MAKEVLRIWVDTDSKGTMSIQSLDHDIDWELELLPETTTLTLLCDGSEKWQKYP